MTFNEIVAEVANRRAAGLPLDAIILTASDFDELLEEFPGNAERRARIRSGTAGLMVAGVRVQVEQR